MKLASAHFSVDICLLADCSTSQMDSNVIMFALFQFIGVFDWFVAFPHTGRMVTLLFYANRVENYII